MFMAAGLIYAALGHDRIAGLAGIARALPTSVLAFALGGVALIGVPPSGAYLAKTAAAPGGERDGAMVVGRRDPGRRNLHQQLRAAGACPCGGARGSADHLAGPGAAPARGGGARARAVLAVARACSLGRISSGRLRRPHLFRSTLEMLSASLWPILAGGALAIVLGRWGHRLAGVPAVVVAAVRRARRPALALAAGLVQVDGTLRQWPAAGLSLLVVAIMFGAAMLAGR